MDQHHRFTSEPRSIAVDEAASHAVDVEPGSDRLAKSRRKATKNLRRVKDLLIYSDPAVAEVMTMFLRRDGAHNKRAVRAAKPKDFGKILSRYERIDTLYIGLHGDATGDMYFGTATNNERFSVGGSLMMKQLEAFTGTVGTVDFLSCRVGMTPKKLARFVTEIRAERAIAHTTWGMFNRGQLQLGGTKATAGWVTNNYQILKPFLHPAEPSLDQILALRKRGRKKIDLLMRAGVLGVGVPTSAEVAQFVAPVPPKELNESRPFGRMIVAMQTEAVHTYQLSDGVARLINVTPGRGSTTNRPDEIHCRIEMHQTLP